MTLLKHHQDRQLNLIIIIIKYNTNVINNQLMRKLLKKEHHNLHNPNIQDL